MAWTVQPEGYKYLAGTGSLKTLLSSPRALTFYATTTPIATCNISGAVDNLDGTVTVSFNVGTAVSGTNTVDNAAITGSNGTVDYFTTDDVGPTSTTPHDIEFDLDSWTGGGQVSPGTITFSLATLTATGDGP